MATFRIVKDCTVKGTPLETNDIISIFRLGFTIAETKNGLVSFILDNTTLNWMRSNSYVQAI